MTLEQRKKISELHSQTNQYRYNLDRSRRIIVEALKKCRNPYIALSGGKDSTVVFELVQSVMAIPCVWSDDEFWFPETGEYINRLKSWHDIRQIRTNCWHSDFFQTHGNYDSIQDYAKQQGFGLCFMGLRKDESSARCVHLRTCGPLFFCKENSVWQCNPIADWTVRDVWAFIDSQDVDYNKAYDKMLAIGIELECQRVGPLAVERVLGRGQIAILKRGWPELFGRFAEKFPDVRSYV